MAGKAKIGINVNTRAPIILDNYSVADMLQIAIAAEEQGYHSAWVGDSLTSKPRLEPLSTLAAIASITTKIKLGTSTLLLPLRNQFPPLFAHAWATLDVISKGRTILGVGVGGGHPRIEDKLEFEMCGVNYEERGARFEEGLELLKQLWTKNNVTFSGKYHKLENVTIEPKPVQKPTPPIWIANALKIFNVKPKTTERILRRTARMGDGITSCCLDDGDLFEEQVLKVLQYREEYKLKGEFETSYQVTLNISDDEERAKNDQRSFLKKYYFIDYTNEQLDAWGPAGNARKILAWFEDFISHKCGTFIVRFAGQNQQEQFKKFNKEILPSL